MLGARSVMRVTAPATALAIAAGIMLGGAGSAEPTASAPQTLTASSETLRISFPSAWRADASTRRLRGLVLSDSISLVRRAGADGEPTPRLVAGMVAETDPGLLPPRLERRLSGIVRAEPVRLGPHQAYRYRNVPLVAGDESLTLYAVPTSEGTAMVACSTPQVLAFIDAMAGECEAMATLLEVRGARSLPVGPNREYGNSVSEVLAAADSERRRYRTALRAAKRHNGQGRRARDLARTFRYAARRLARRGSEAGTATVHAELLGGLRAVAEGYDALAAGAFRADRADYDSARRQILRAEARLSRTLNGMRWLGYRVGSRDRR